MSVPVFIIYSSLVVCPRIYYLLKTKERASEIHSSSPPSFARQEFQNRMETKDLSFSRGNRPPMAIQCFYRGTPWSSSRILGKSILRRQRIILTSEKVVKNCQSCVLGQLLLLSSVLSSLSVYVRPSLLVVESGHMRELINIISTFV